MDIERIRASHIGETIQLRGIVSYVSADKIGISSVVYRCMKCLSPHTVEIEVPYGKRIKPRKCSNETDCGRVDPGFELDNSHHDPIDFRTIQLGSLLSERHNIQFGELTELVVTDIETSIHDGDVIICEAQIRSNATRGPMAVPYAFSDNITVDSGYHTHITDTVPRIRAILIDICSRSNGDGTAHITEIYNWAELTKIPESAVDGALSNLQAQGEAELVVTDVSNPLKDVYKWRRRSF